MHGLRMYLVTALLCMQNIAFAASDSPTISVDYDPNDPFDAVVDSTEDGPLARKFSMLAVKFYPYEINSLSHANSLSADEMMVYERFCFYMVENSNPWMIFSGNKLKSLKPVQIPTSALNKDRLLDYVNLYPEYGKEHDLKESVTRDEQLLKLLDQGKQMNMLAITRAQLNTGFYVFSDEGRKQVKQLAGTDAGRLRKVGKGLNSAGDIALLISRGVMEVANKGFWYGMLTPSDADDEAALALAIIGLGVAGGGLVVKGYAKGFDASANLQLNRNLHEANLLQFLIEKPSNRVYDFLEQDHPIFRDSKLSGEAPVYSIMNAQMAAAKRTSESELSCVLETQTRKRMKGKMSPQVYSNMPFPLVYRLAITAATSVAVDNTDLASNQDTVEAIDKSEYICPDDPMELYSRSVNYSFFRDLDRKFAEKYDLKVD